MATAAGFCVEKQVEKLACMLGDAGQANAAYLDIIEI